MKYHDLSANTIKIDYPSLLSTARIAVGETLQNIRRHTEAIANHDQTAVGWKASLSLTAEWLLREAKRMEIAANTLDVLEGMQSRDEIVWVNREVKQEQNGKPND